MKLKNVKVGTRVELKEDLYDGYFVLHKGLEGTIINDNCCFPCVSWDNFTLGHNGDYCGEPNRVSLSLPENSVWAVDVSLLKRIKG